LLSQHPQVEAGLRAELNAVLGGRLPVMNDLRGLPYTDQVIKEAMRLYPPAWLITRLAIEAVKFGEHTIPKGSILIMSQYGMHRHPDYWDEPDAFRPERFAPGWEDRVPKFAYFPFGGGPRICIGNSFAAMEAVLVLATIMQRWTFRLAPGHTVEMEPLITLRPKHGMPMRVQQREIILT
jgi:cytochrome P450